MPRALTVLAVALAALVSGCGGPDIAYTEVTSEPAGLPIPDGTVTSSTGAQTTTGPTGRVRPRSTPEADTDTATDTTTVPEVVTEVPTTVPVVPETPEVVPEDTTDDDTGAAAPPTTEEPEPVVPEDTSGGATAPTDQFCADNPGACNN